ncbi:TniQ family protein [Nocardia sp. CA-129566]|uniref:TniQ family protein n=1 Tax=Nocardia sp. CA-129566 TaxID=3239976 RepID=UPI003D95992E
MDSWLEALARRHSSPGQLLTALGFHGNRRIRPLLDPSSPRLLRRLENAAGLSIHASDATIGVAVGGMEQVVLTGSRFCPQCLSASGGRWHLSWCRKWRIARGEHRIQLTARKPAGLQPFPDIAVTRLRMTRVALTVLADLRRRTS